MQIEIIILSEKKNHLKIKLQLDINLR